MKQALFFCGAFLACAVIFQARAQENFAVNIHVDATKPLGELHPIWRFFGADEPNYAYMTNGRKLIGEMGALKPKQVYFRTHNLLNSGDGTPAVKWGSTGAYSQDTNGNPVYNWTIVDRIFDTYLERGVRPYAEIGFMPKELSTHPDPYQHHWKPGDNYNDIYTGWSYPPTNYEKWGDVVYQWVKHCVDKYGKAEVEQWYWEVWNEADIGYWRGRPQVQSFEKLHDYAIDAVRRALPTARVGGPDAAYGGGAFFTNFLEHCVHGTNYATGKPGTPIDFISFHAKGGPTLTNGHVRMGIGQQLRAIDGAFRIIASYPELKSKPIVIGESDPDGCAACAEAEYPQYGYRNGPQFASYTAAVFARKHEIAERRGVNLEGALSWAFEFEDMPFFAGFRTLASNGIDKPVFNVFRMFSLMSGQRLTTESDHGVSLDNIMRRGVRGDADVSALASLDTNKLCVMVWHYHDDEVAGPAADVNLALDGLPVANGKLRVEQFRIDEDHSNAFGAWKKLGSPQQPTKEQYAQLEQAGQLATMGVPETVETKDGKATVKFALPRQGVALVKVTW